KSSTSSVSLHNQLSCSTYQLRVRDAVYKRASELGVLVKPKSGEGEYEGWCWPGSSSWIDFFHPGSWDFWISLFKTKSVDGQWSWTESTDNVGIWNDMNEPSVFNGPEITMPKDNVHYGGWEHRDVHNINGMLFANHTYQAAAARTDPPRRPFVLTRAFYAGSQRFGRNVDGRQPRHMGTHGSRYQNGPRQWSRRNAFRWI
ncbi:glycosyl hydrolases family 31-domain-containing protein, partial [Suillus ampliporus]